MQNLCASNDASMALLLYLDRAMLPQGQYCPKKLCIIQCPTFSQEVRGGAHVCARGRCGPAIP